MRLLSNHGNERGIALVATLLAMLVVVGLMAGAFAAINSDQRLISIDRDQTQAYAAAHAGLEKLTSDLSQLFQENVSPTIAQINELSTHPPDLRFNPSDPPLFHFIAPGEAPVANETATSGYQITWNGFPGTPTPIPNAVIAAGPYQGLRGMITPYTITVTARSATGGAEVRLRRDLRTVAVPVFQFGVFSEGDLTFYAGSNFGFGGRVHTNGHLFLSQLNGTTLTFSDRMTAVGNVVRSHLSNDEPIGNLSFTGTVRVIRNFPATYATMAPLDDSVKGNPGAWVVNNNEGSTAVKGWINISNVMFNGNIKNSLTGAKRLDLPLVDETVGAEPIDLIRRPASATEDNDNQALFSQRFFSTAGLRILLSDRAADITNLPTVTPNPPIQLRGLWNAAPPAGYGAVGPNRPPIARSMGPLNPLNPLLNPHVIAAAPNGIIGGAPNMSITLRNNVGDPAFPTQFTLQNISVTLPAGGTHVMTCQRKAGTPNPTNANTFELCAPQLPVAIPSGMVVSMTHTDGPTVTTLTNSPAGWNAANATTLRVVDNGTLAFAPIYFFTQDNSGGAAVASMQAPTAVSCTGYDLPLRRFLGCSWWGSTWNDDDPGGQAGKMPAPGHQVVSAALSSINEPLIDGFIKIERRDLDGNWTDVTAEVLSFGIGAPNQDGFVCGDPTPNAILRLQRLKDNAYRNLAGAPNVPGACPNPNSTNPYDWWPNVLYDAREGIQRDVLVGDRQLRMGGLMHYISLDVNNLRLWFQDALPGGGSGDLVARDNGGTGGYIVYFSDRRGNHRNVAGFPETGEYGFEDVVNRNQMNGTPNGSPDIGEDFNANTIFDVYGGAPSALPGVVPMGALAPYTIGATPTTPVTHAAARINKAILFRRALKLINGGINGAGFNNMPPQGLTVAAENPVYVQGNYNANNDPNTNPDNNATQPNVPAAILADAVTLLSRQWVDTWSFRSGPTSPPVPAAAVGFYPHDQNARPALTTGYRVAVISGKGLSFPYNGTAVPAGMSRLFGTDGGMGNFLRLLEDWQTPGASINYRGSVVSLFTSRQATGTFKWGPNVYVYSTRNFMFDNDFLQPALLPPGTPMFRDVNVLNFRQILRPNQ